MPRVHALALVRNVNMTPYVALQNEVSVDNRYLGYFLPMCNEQYYPKYSFRVHNWITKDSFDVDLIHDGYGVFYINFQDVVFIFTVKRVHYLRKKIIYQGRAMHEDFNKPLVELQVNNQDLHDSFFNRTGFVLLGSDTYSNYEN